MGEANQTLDLFFEIIDNDRIEYARHGLDKEIYVLKNHYR